MNIPTSDSISNHIGNVLIKHKDKWRGNYYLQDDLTFSPDKSRAGNFYILKQNDTTILNGDRISIHLGNRTLVVTNNGIKLVDRNESHNYNDSLVVTTGLDDTNPISYETELYFITSKTHKTALKYTWVMDLIVSIQDRADGSNYRPRDRPNLTNDSYEINETTSEMNGNNLKFILEKTHQSNINSDTARSTTAIALATSTAQDTTGTLDSYKGVIMIVLLMIVLVLCMLISK